MESASCYCVGAIGALLKTIYLLHPDIYHNLRLPPSDDDDYSSVDETSDDEDPTPQNWPSTYNALRNPEYPRKLAPPFTVTAATVAYAAESLRIVDGYYPPRLDDEDEDSSSDEDSDSSSEEESDEDSDSSDADY